MGTLPNTHAVNARESARKGNGEFGAQQRDSTALSLTPAAADRTEIAVDQALAHPELYPLSYDVKADPNMSVRHRVSRAIVQDAAVFTPQEQHSAWRLAKAAEIATARPGDPQAHVALEDATLALRAREVGAPISDEDYNVLTAAVRQGWQDAADADDYRMAGLTARREQESSPAPGSMEDIFGPPILVYTTQDALRDGTLVEPDAKLSREAGYKVPVVLTAEANSRLVAWDGDGMQDATGRYWDVLNTARAAAKRAAANPGQRQSAQVLAVPRFTASGAKSRSTLHPFEVVVQDYDGKGTPCVTILLPEED